MSFIYEIYYENKAGEIVLCTERNCEMEAISEINNLSIEFPENYYWYDIVGDVSDD